jgi:hypothetical protein
MGRVWDSTLARRPSQRRHHYLIVSTQVPYRMMSDVPHVRWGLDGGNELKSRVAHTNYADNCAGHDAEPALTDDN